jgi:alpha-beta hydrolase superfamily lysophospholipase
MSMPFKQTSVSVALCTAVLLATAPSFAGTIPSGPAGDAFYVPPQSLPVGQPGSAIWTRPFEGTMALPGAARNRLLLYRSLDPAANIVSVSGTIAIPPGTPPAGGWPVITWTHGTTGLAPICAPSLDNKDGPEHEYIAVIQTLLDGFVRHGYAIVATDYQGLGTAIGIHPFLQGNPNGQNALDILRAARQAEPELGTRYAVAGHSQGGHAALFTAAEGPGYAPDFQLVGVIAFAPGSHVAERLDAVRHSAKVELALPYVLYVLETYGAYHPEIDLKRILTPEALSHLPDLQIACMSHALTTGYWSTAIAQHQFLPDPELAPLLKVATTNEPGRLKIAVPTAILQGESDVTVRPVDTDDVAKKLCAAGNTLEYRPYPGKDHDGVMTAGAEFATVWVDARFAGKPASSNCASLPSAVTKP